MIAEGKCTINETGSEKVGTLRTTGSVPVEPHVDAEKRTD